jgi:hypothetical protein
MRRPHRHLHARYRHPHRAHPIPLGMRPHRLTQAWLQAVSTHDPHTVVSLYAPQAILLGTVAPKILVGKPAIKTYFDTFLKKPGLSGRTTWECPQALPGGLFMLTGLYTFSWVGNSVNARYTFLWAPVGHGGNYLILNHHSSAVPK